jgi:hypothetical protein
MSRTCTGSACSPPSRVTARSCSTRSSRACSACGMSPISSRNSLPPCACSNLPRCARIAPVNAPFSQPQPLLKPWICLCVIEHLERFVPVLCTCLIDVVHQPRLASSQQLLDAIEGLVREEALAQVLGRVLGLLASKHAAVRDGLGCYPSSYPSIHGRLYGHHRANSEPRSTRHACVAADPPRAVGTTSDSNAAISRPSDRIKR